MDREMERIAMESNTEMISSMLSICRDMTISKSHTSNALSAKERTQFTNCLLKFFESPNHVMTAMAQADQMQ